MDIVNWDRLAGILHDRFMTLVPCDIYRTVKTQDDIGGDIEETRLLYQNVDCYCSQHPWYDTRAQNVEAVWPKLGHYRAHFAPDVDIRDGDIVEIKIRPPRKFVVGRLATYPTHTRVELSVWDVNT